MVLSVICFLHVPLFSISDLAQQVHDAYLQGQELHLKASWPMQAMTWAATNLEARGRLFEVPLPVPVVLSLADDAPIASGSTYPPVITHDATCRPSGAYQPDAGTFGMFVCSLVFSYRFSSLFYF